jgi:hypothetical protein
MATSRTNPAYRRQKQIADTNHRRSTRQTNPREIRAQENERNAASMATRHTDPSYRTQENERNAQDMATSCTNPAYRRQEQIADTNRRRLAREQPFFMTWQLSSILQVAHTYIISLADME